MNAQCNSKIYIKLTKLRGEDIDEVLDVLIMDSLMAHETSSCM